MTIGQMTDECQTVDGHSIDRQLVSDLAIQYRMFRTERGKGASVNGKPPVSKTGTGGSSPSAPVKKSRDK